MLNNVIAGRYAKGVFQAVQTLEKAAAIKAELEKISQVIADNAELSFVYYDPTIDIYMKNSVVDEIFSGMLPETLNLVKAMIGNHKEELLGDVIHALDEIIHKKDNKQLGRLIVAKAVTAQQKSAIETKVSQKLDMNIVLKEEIDKEVLGGFKIEVGSFLIDSTIKKQLENLKKLSI